MTDEENRRVTCRDGACPEVWSDGLLPPATGFGDSILNCRDCDSANRVHPECWPIEVPQNDPYFPPVDVSSGRPFCIAFTRSLPGQQSLGQCANRQTASPGPPNSRKLSNGDILKHHLDNVSSF